MEASELGVFMFGACIFGTLIFDTRSPLHGLVRSSLGERVVMGLAMGTMASSIILSPAGRRSGAHMNPVVSFTFFCLGKVHWVDALLYSIAQFCGGAVAY